MWLDDVKIQPVKRQTRTDMYACHASDQATVEMIPIENVVEQVFLGIDPRRGQDGEAWSYFVQSKGHLHGRRAVMNGVDTYGN